MSRISLQAAALAALTVTVPATTASAHCYVGGRFLPTTLTVDDPCVADELSLPTVSRIRNGEEPAGHETEISGEYSKRLTDTFGASVEWGWVGINTPDAPDATGWDNLETAVKSQFLTLPEHELVMSAELGVEWGGTGTKDVDADTFSTLTPTLYVGKGFGDLPDAFGFIRAFAVTGNIGYAMPTQSTSLVADEEDETAPLEEVNNPQSIVWGGSLQFSMPYLKSSVVDLGLPDFVNHLIPVVELAVQNPVSNNFGTENTVTGTVNPGVIWIGDYGQFGVEAMLPINRESGASAGVIAQAHFFLDDIFPHTIGKPLIER